MKEFEVIVSCKLKYIVTAKTKEDAESRVENFCELPKEYLEDSFEHIKTEEIK